MEKLKERNMTKYVLLSIFTLGLYPIYFYYKLGRDIDAVCEGDGKETVSYIVAIVLGLLTFGIFSIYWVYQIGQRLHVNAPRYGFKMVETGLDTVVLNFIGFGFISTYVFIKNINRIAIVYNNNGLADVNEGGRI